MPSIYQFPEDLASSQQGHYMQIDAYQTFALNRAGFIEPSQTRLDTFAFFIPGGQTNGQSLTWSHLHEYTDVKLARVFGQALGVLADVAGVGAGAVGTAAGAAAFMGHPINPRVDVLFRNTNLREYQFMFLLAPQSDRESEMMKTMLQRLRFHAAPELGSVFYTSPSEFQIRFFYINEQGRSVENDHIPKIARGVIKRIDIDYTPTGEWSTFYNGAPVSALLTFTFAETTIIDKKAIDQGY